MANGIERKLLWGGLAVVAPLALAACIGWGHSVTARLDSGDATRIAGFQRLATLEAQVAAFGSRLIRIEDKLDKLLEGSGK